eukprot:6482360-Amphidinium_carterae.1
MPPPPPRCRPAANDLFAEKFGPASVREVKRALLLGCLRKAAGHDGLPLELWRFGGTRLAVHLTLLYNQIAVTGEVPHHMAHSLWIPVKKPGKLGNMAAHFRPIALLPAVTKCLERVILARLKSTMMEVHPNQHGFRSGSSTLSAIGGVTHLIQHTMAAGMGGSNRLGVLQLDLASAFDKVQVPELAKVMLNRGADLVQVRLIWSLLRQRTAAVRLNAFTSDAHHIRLGVPQGSVLSPFLFCHYTHSLVVRLNQLEGVRVLAYADNFTVMAKANSVGKVQKLLENALVEAKTELQPLGIEVSATKSAAHLFSPHPHEAQAQLSVADLASAYSVEIDSSTWPAYSMHLCLAGRSLLLIDHPELSGPTRIVAVGGLTHFTHDTIADLLRDGGFQMELAPLVPNKEVLELLGIRLSTSLSVAPHTAALRAYLHKRLPLIRRLSGPSWGADRDTVRRLTQAYVRGGLVHGLGALYWLASDAVKLQFDRLDRAMARVVTKVPKGSSSGVTQILS